MKRDQLWEACCNVFRTHHLLQEDNSLMEEVVESVLGLLLNLSRAMSPCLEKFGVELCSKCLEMIKLGKCSEPLRVRGVGILSHILPHSDIACNAVVDSGGTEILLEYIKDERLCYKPALKALTAITKCNEAGRKYIVDNKGLGTLIKRLKSEDETIVGNAALCLSHCTQVSKVCALLTKTDIIKDLLVLARDGKKPAVQQNCAILIAKLAQGDSKHLERLRELHGVEILHSCMKYIK
ncbi:hypothetical protein DPMN_074791 [Dreissena polymorpha]|uniref:Uncharacterized protein n=2 Tax=Dreissena polymorpha TaxID=45954 RepID=A0A9D4BKY8_DREPO|nr:hypothetical protein DPMN_074791 [Dreissena polymorpha]